MKKMFNSVVLYFTLAMVAGVFYREFTKFNGFVGETTLGLVHGHLLMLGVFLFIILMIINKLVNIEDDKKFNRFFILHNISLPLMSACMVVRGITQVLGLELSKAINASLSGISGLSHIGLLISLITLIMLIKDKLVDNK